MSGSNNRASDHTNWQNSAPQDTARQEDRAGAEGNRAQPGNRRNSNSHNVGGRQPREQLQRRQVATAPNDQTSGAGTEGRPPRAVGSRVHARSPSFPSSPPPPYSEFRAAMPVRQGNSPAEPQPTVRADLLQLGLAGGNSADDAIDIDELPSLATSKRRRTAVAPDGLGVPATDDLPPYLPLAQAAHAGPSHRPAAPTASAAPRPRNNPPAFTPQGQNASLPPDPTSLNRPPPAGKSTANINDARPVHERCTTGEQSQPKKRTKQKQEDGAQKRQKTREERGKGKRRASPDEEMKTGSEEEERVLSEPEGPSGRKDKGKEPARKEPERDDEQEVEEDEGSEEYKAARRKAKGKARMTAPDEEEGAGGSGEENSAVQAGLDKLSIRTAWAMQERDEEESSASSRERSQPSVEQAHYWVGQTASINISTVYTCPHVYSQKPTPPAHYFTIYEEDNVPDRRIPDDFAGVVANQPASVGVHVLILWFGYFRRNMPEFQAHRAQDFHFTKSLAATLSIYHPVSAVALAEREYEPDEIMRIVLL